MLLSFTLDLPIDCDDLELVLHCGSDSPTITDGIALKVLENFCKQVDVPRNHPRLVYVADRLKKMTIIPLEEPYRVSDE